jgi:hypothetical protein
MKAQPLRFVPLLLIVLLSWPLNIEAAGPKLVLGDSFYDAKEVREVQIIEHTLFVANAGDQVLYIRDVNSD